MRIYKHRLEIGINTIALPKGSIILAFKFQRTLPTIWVLTTDQSSMESRVVEILPTGAQMDFNNFKYLGTDIDNSGYVAHGFEILS